MPAAIDLHWAVTPYTWDVVEFGINARFEPVTLLEWLGG